MKKIITAIMALSLVSSVFAGVQEYEMEQAGGGISHELVFVAKTNEAVVLRIAHKGFADVLADEVADDLAETRYGFAFGQPDGGADPSAFENYVIDLLSPLNSSSSDEICGNAADNAADNEQAIKIFEGTTENFTTSVSGAVIDLAGSCSLDDSDPAGAVVSASAKIAYEVEAAGSATVELEMIVTDGLDADLITPDAALSFDTLSVAQSHFDASQVAKAGVDIEASPATIAHGEYGELDISLSFAVTGANAKAERRSSILLVGSVPL